MELIVEAKHLGQFLKENGVESLHQLIQSDIGKKS